MTAISLGKDYFGNLKACMDRIVHNRARGSVIGRKRSVRKDGVNRFLDFDGKALITHAVSHKLFK